MSALLKSQLRFARWHPVGALASLAGITLAVMAVVTIHLLSQSVRRSLDSWPGESQSHTHVLTATTLSEADYFNLRRRWRQGEFNAVQAMAPVVDDFIDIGGEAYRVVGLDPLAGGFGGGATTGSRDAASNSGEFLTGDVVLASTETARAIAAASMPVAVVVAPDRDAAIPIAAAGVVVADLPTAQRLLDREGQLDAVWLTVASTRSRLLRWLDLLLPGIAAALPRYADPAIDGFEIVAARQWNPASRFADALAFNLGALSMLSLLMAALVAVQASYSNAARRRREHERLVMIGVSRSRLRALAVGEGLAIGGLGAALGIGLGILVTTWLLAAANAGADAAELDHWIVAKAAICGVAVSALGPAFANREPGRRGWFRNGAGIVAVAVAAFGLLQDSLPLAFAALLALCALQMAYTVPLAGAVAGKLAALARSIAARGNLRAAASKVGELRLALGALSVATATAIGMGLMVESLRRDFTAMLDQRLWQGIYVSAEPGVADDDVDWIRAQPGVHDVRRYGDVDARLANGPTRISLADLDTTETARYEFAGALAESAMLNEVGARLFDLGIGDTVTVTGGGASLEVAIGHVFRDFGAPMPRLILPMALQSGFRAESVRWQRLAVAAEASAVRGLTAALAERFGAANVRNQNDIRAAAMAVFDRTFIVSRSLTGVALAVAVIGLYAALTALQASREREFTLLSAMGYSRAGIWRLATIQTSILGAIAAISAVPLGIAIAWVLCDVVQPLAFGWSIKLRGNAASIAYPATLGILGATAAGAIPAYRSSFR